MEKFISKSLTEFTKTISIENLKIFWKFLIITKNGRFRWSVYGEHDLSGHRTSVYQRFFVARFIINQIKFLFLQKGNSFNDLKWSYFANKNSGFDQVETAVKGIKLIICWAEHNRAQSGMSLMPIPLHWRWQFLKYLRQYSLPSPLPVIWLR